MDCGQDATNGGQTTSKKILQAYDGRVNKYVRMPFWESDGSWLDRMEYAVLVYGKYHYKERENRELASSVLRQVIDFDETKITADEVYELLLVMFVEEDHTTTEMSTVFRGMKVKGRVSIWTENDSSP